MSVTFTFEVKKKPTAKGLFPVYLRITKDRKHKRIKTSVSLHRLSDWNPDGYKNEKWVRSSERDAGVYNTSLAKELRDAQQVYRDDKTASLDNMALKAKGGDRSSSFMDFAISSTEKLEQEGKSSAKHYRTFCNKFFAFLNSKGRSDISFTEISVSTIKDFEHFLTIETSEKNKSQDRRLNTNYIRTLIIKFRALVNDAIDEGLIDQTKYPFRNYHMPKEVSAHKEALDESEIQSIIDLDYPKGSWLWHTKNAFLFSFYCAGIRAGDLLQLRWRNILDSGNRLVYTMDKNHKERKYPLVNQAKAIIAMYHSEAVKPTDYIFPWLDSDANYAVDCEIDTMPVELKKKLLGQIYSKNTLLNKYLKTIASDAGIKKNVSFHVSRHSFATIASAKAVPSKIIQEALGHSSLTTTERYLHELKNNETDQALEEVFGNDISEESILSTLRKLGPNTLKNLVSKLNSQ